MAKTYAARRVAPSDRDIEGTASVLGLLARRDKLKILYALAHGERNIVDVGAIVGEEMPVITRHMAVLRAARLVRSERCGRAVCYELTDLGRAALLMADRIRKCARNGPDGEA